MSTFFGLNRKFSKVWDDTQSRSHCGVVGVALDPLGGRLSPGRLIRVRIPGSCRAPDQLTSATIRVDGTTYEVAGYSAATPPGRRRCPVRPAPTDRPRPVRCRLYCKPAGGRGRCHRRLFRCQPGRSDQRACVRNLHGVRRRRIQSKAGLRSWPSCAVRARRHPNQHQWTSLRPVVWPDVEGGTATALLPVEPEPGSGAVVFAGVLGLAGLSRRPRSIARSRFGQRQRSPTRRVR